MSLAIVKPSPQSPAHNRGSTGASRPDAATYPPGDNDHAADLPYSDGAPLESQVHRELMELVIGSLRPWLGTRGYIGGNMFVYFRPADAGPESTAHKNCGPDVFVALDVEPRVRRKWVCWQERKVPDVIIEFLSDTTQEYDKTDKKAVYQNELRVPEYYWFNPESPEQFAGFRLHEGVYMPIEPDPDGRLISQRLGGLRLGHWHGRFHDTETTWLRWFTADGERLLTTGESETKRANEEKQRADGEKQRADGEKQRADALARKLRSLGIDPDACH